MISRPSSLLLYLSFTVTLSVAAAASAISLGSTLFTSNNQTLSSPSSTFSLGFVAKPSNPSSFLAAITYSGGAAVDWSSSATVVWSTTATVDSAGSLQFLSSGDLRLVNGSGTIVWSTNTASREVTSASLDDSGNLVLRNATTAVWSSFDHPTDTIVQTQKLTASKALTSGLYSFALESSGNLTLAWNNSVVYWNQGLNSSAASNLTSPSLNLQSTGILSISDPSFASEAILFYSSDFGEGNDILRFLKLDSDGNLRIYSSAMSSGIVTVTVRWAAVVDQCKVFGYCGNFSICSYNSSNNNTNAICTCPSQNFELIDLKDSTKGCKRKVEIDDCPRSTTMLELDHALFLTYQPELSSEVVIIGISACRQNCLVSDSCGASTSLSDGTGICYLKTSNYFSGYQNPLLPSTSYVKVCGPVDPNPTSSDTLTSNIGWRTQPWFVAVVVLVTIFGLVLLEGGLWFWCFRNSPKFGGLTSQYEYALVEYTSGAPVKFSYKEMQRSTKGFKEKLGAGGFGAVYRGVLANRTVVAVKQLEGIEQGEKQFRMEVATISSTHHLNLVRLIGFCSEGRHRLLVYEFVKNGSLDNFLFEQQSGKFLSWEHRYNIALGTAKGITYLHEECRDCIVHCDIKPENILLDENYNAKVCDFGLAQLINPKDHQYRTLKSVRGTRGYLAPEWLANLLITSKTDVYSYGMVLLEIISGRRNFEVSAETNQKKFSVWAYEEFDKGHIEGFVDKRLLADSQELKMDQVVRAVQVGFWCIQEQPSHRPTMGKVVQMLEGVMPIERPPAPRAAPEGSVGGNSITTYSASAPAPSSSFSSHRTIGVPTLASDKNTDKGSASDCLLP